MAARLSLATEADWKARLYEISSVSSRPTTLTPAVRERLARTAALPDPEQFSVSGVITYQAGSLIFYYAPTGDVDRSDEVRRYVGEVVRCPRSRTACPAGVLFGLRPVSAPEAALRSC